MGVSAEIQLGTSRIQVRNIPTTPANLLGLHSFHVDLPNILGENYYSIIL
jgi:hypothetical protein